jgi:hypothetical protein
MNSEESYRKLLSYVTVFMVKGRDSVANKDWKGRQGWYLLKDKKPDDFAEQLEATLKHLKENKINEQAEALAREWGYLL